MEEFCCCPISGIFHKQKINLFAFNRTNRLYRSMTNKNITSVEKWLNLIDHIVWTMIANCKECSSCQHNRKCAKVLHTFSTNSMAKWERAEHIYNTHAAKHKKALCKLEYNMKCAERFLNYNSFHKVFKNWVRWQDNTRFYILLYIF